MKDSGLGWIGYIPSLWDVQKIKYHLRRYEPKNPGNQPVLSLYRDHGVIPKDSRDDNHNVTSEDTSKYKYVQPGNFVINKMKAWQGSVAVSDYEGVVSPAYYVYCFTDTVFHLPYFHYLLRSCYQAEFRRLSGGIREGQWDLPAPALENTRVLIPPIEEQRRIAAFLDERCAAIDAERTVLEDEVEALRHLRAATIDHAVSKGLDNHVCMAPSNILWAKSIPAHWKVMAYKYVAKVRANLADPFKYPDLPQISPDNIEKSTGRLLDGIPTVSEAGTISDNHLFKRGQILYSKIRPALNKVTIAPYDGMCSADMYPIETSENYRWLMYYMLSGSFMQQIAVSGDRVKMPKINKEELGRIKCLVPPREEQEAIARYLDKRCADIDAVIETRTKQISRLEDYRKALIFQYVTGKKEVPHE